jgi:polyisoprenoid-binding protein YceI
MLQHRFINLKLIRSMKRILILFAVLFISIASFAQSLWKADSNHSKLTFTITHLGISDVAGLFKTFDATVVATKPDFSDAVFEVTAQTNSINTEIDKRDGHLKSADFFDVEKFPVMTFKSNSIKKVSDGKYTLSGNLTLHGTTKPVTMDLWYRGTIANPTSKAPTAGFQVTGTIKRSDFDFGSKYLSPMLSDEVHVKADGEFTQPK